jgi:hypothetical protein
MEVRNDTRRHTESMEPDVHAQQRVVTGERTVEEATYAKKFMVCN